MIFVFDRSQIFGYSPLNDISKAESLDCCFCIFFWNLFCIANHLISANIDVSFGLAIKSILNSGKFIELKWRIFKPLYILISVLKAVYRVYRFIMNLEIELNQWIRGDLLSSNLEHLFISAWSAPMWKDARIKNEPAGSTCQLYFNIIVCPINIHNS